MTEIQKLVEGSVDVIRWTSEYAECRCPLDHEARVYINLPTPYLHCLHERCQDEVQEVNQALREAGAWLPDVAAKVVLTPKEKHELEWKRHLRRLETRAREFVLPAL